MVIVPCVERGAKQGSMERTPELGSVNSLALFRLSVGGCREGTDLDVKWRTDSTVFKTSFYSQVP